MVDVCLYCTSAHVPRHNMSFGSLLPLLTSHSLRYLHDSKVVHSDLKPGNVMFEPSVRLTVKITDFGLAKTRDSSRASFVGGVASGSVGGTVPYIAPELLDGPAKGTPSVDVYSYVVPVLEFAGHTNSYTERERERENCHPDVCFIHTPHNMTCFFKYTHAHGWITGMV